MVDCLWKSSCSFFNGEWLAKVWWLGGLNVYLKHKGLYFNDNVSNKRDGILIWLVLFSSYLSTFQHLI